MSLKFFSGSTRQSKNIFCKEGRHQNIPWMNKKITYMFNLAIYLILYSNFTTLHHVLSPYVVIFCYLFVTCSIGHWADTMQPNRFTEPHKARRVLASSRLGMPCYGETKYMVLMYGPWRFQKCIWEP